MVDAIRKNSNIENDIRDLYLVLFQKTLGGCGSCLADALIVLYTYPESKIKQIMECKFKLRAGALLIDATSQLPNVTAANLTDDLAIAYLRDNIKRKDMFEVLPDNLEELLNGGAQKKAQKPRKSTPKRKSASPSPKSAKNGSK